MVADLVNSKDCCADSFEATGCILEDEQPATNVGKQPSSIELRRLVIRQFNNLRTMAAADLELFAKLD